MKYNPQENPFPLTTKNCILPSMRIILFFLLLIISHEAKAADPSLLYTSLDPLSISQNLAFYELYPEVPEGKKALHRAWTLLTEKEDSASLILPSMDLSSLISLLTRQPSETCALLSDEQLELLERIGSGLHHRKLKGHEVKKTEDVLSLSPDEVDLARALLLYQFSGDDLKPLLQYEATLDLMALQIRARLPKQATDEDKVREISRFIFQEMGFRYPPLSVHVKDIDLYTLLPSVLDNRKGVCLGVSILYLCLAQRLNLTLEIVTPPGHIFVRFPKEDGALNIETTARGIHLPSETYLGINTRTLETKNMKEVLGLAFINHASLYLRGGNYEQASLLYEKAALFLPNYPLLKMLTGINLLFLGKKKEGTSLLKSLEPLTFDYAVSRETLATDYLNGWVDIEGLKSIFLSVDETQDSILAKQKELQKILKRYPKFRAGLLQLATTHLQLRQTSEALSALLAYHVLDPYDATVEYYLAILSLERMDYPRSWEFLTNVKNLTAKRNHHPKALQSLELSLKRLCPSPFLDD